MNESRNRSFIIYGLILISILKILTILVSIIWLESYWTLNPPRPDVSFNIIIIWTLIEIPFAIWLWFPQRGAWIALFVYDLLHLALFSQILMVATNGLSQFMILTVILVIVQLLILLVPKTRAYYGILSS